MSPTPACEVGLTLRHRRYVPASHAHYAGNLVDGAYCLGLFGDVATELCITTDEDEGLFAGYDRVEFLAPVRAGDLVEVTAVLAHVGRRSRRIDFAAHVVGRGAPEETGRPSGARLLVPPLLAVTATGTCVVPAP